MNKYLSYEKSKRLAELGYKPNTFSKYWCNQWGTFNDYYLQDSDLDQGTCDAIPAPDCHDLLMELEGKIDIACKGNKHCVRLFPNGQDHGIIYYDEIPELIEALGAALIKLLEEEQK